MTNPMIEKQNSIQLQVTKRYSCDVLVVAGRCLSADQLAHSAVRVMPSCIAMGQAAGTAAAMAVRNGQELRELDHSALRAQLIADGVMLEDA